MHDAASCSKEDSLCERVGPCDTLSCFFFSALWLQRSQFILVQEIQSTKDINLTCFKTFPINATLCLQSGPISLDWPVDPFAEFDQSRPSFSPEDPVVVQQRGDIPGFTHSLSSQDALPPPPQVLQSTAVWNGCGHFLDGRLRFITWNTRGLIGSFFPSRRTENSNSNISRCFLTTTTFLSPRSTWMRHVSPGFSGWLRGFVFF